MSPALDLSRRLLLGGGRRDRQTLALSVLAVALALTVVALTLGAIQGLSERDHRADWTRPAAAAADSATAVQSLSTTYVDGRPVQVVRLAALPGADAADLPVPPGMRAFPAPGQAAWSPALRALLADRPAQAAALGGKDSGAATLGDDVVAGPDQLVAVVGVPVRTLRDTPTWQDPVAHGTLVAPTRIDGFAGTASGEESEGTQYVALGWIAAVLLVVPVLTLGGAAVRLGARRRSERFAALRLAGAPAGLLRRCLALEVGLVVVAGAAAAWLVTFALTPLVARVSVGGGRFRTGDLRLDALAWLGLVAGAGLLLTASAAPTLRAALRNPLAVVQAHTPRSPGWWRVAVAALVVVGFSQVARSDGASLVLVMIVFAGLFGVLNVIGPLVVTLLGRIMLVLSRGRGPGLLLAARRVLDDPRAVWRVVSGVVLAAFVAGFLALFQVAGAGDLGTGTARTYEVVVPADGARAAADRAEDALRTAGLDLPVRVGDPDVLWAVSAAGTETTTLQVRLPTAPAAADQARGALAAAFPGAPAASGADVASRDAQFPEDFAVAALVVLLTSFLVAASATAITVAATTLDRRETYRRLWHAGVPVTVLDRARTLESLVPVVVGTALATGAGIFAAAPLTLQGGGVSASGVGMLALTAAIGLAGVLLAVRCSRPLLLAVARS
ncbi:hypothetical protein [Pimelobacter simplex]|uniref:hypothetical protein n=1 Tax=Nocardioides simplex TaxID=2045 RepID=UPI00214FA806|nr:hypothetical protein [Pimelobacter simplex]UUW90672.1 hypothetical protein M0M43_04065 [Pimelobacter simplex]UUW94501.1 hypothetical protein M0M48_22570 [Pimelobacter simplex]